MKINKVQKEIFRSLMDEKHPAMQMISDTEVAITPDGYKGFVLPLQVINFNLSKVQTATFKDIFVKSETDKKLSITNDLRIMSDGTRVARKLVCANEGETITLKDGEGDPKKVTEMWVQNKYLDYFDNPELWASDAANRVLVCEPMRSSKAANGGGGVVGVILPMRVR